MNPLGLWTSLRSQIDSYAGVLGTRFLPLIWIGAAAAAIWVFGPRLPIGEAYPLAPARPRLILIGAMLVLWAIWALLTWRRGRGADDALIEGATVDPKAAGREEVKILQDRLKAALRLMRRTARRRWGYAYAFPWYLMMGAPGAGKTTLIQNSGLKFPLGNADGADPVAGVGGTRDCNWWFTDQAVLIDTAGRYTTQDSDRARDAAGFTGFLAMLRKTRKDQPINGILLTLSLTDLLSQDPADRLREVRAIRERLAEVEDTLRARVPVYLLLTKADRLPGFGAFFDDLGAAAREQVWGTTFDLTDDRSVPDRFSTEFRALQDRLVALLPGRLQQEADIDERGAIFRFPAQVAALHDSLREVVEELASGTEGVRPPLIRGVYFVSATQEASARRAATAPARSMNRSFFVSTLIGKVVLGEAALVTQDARVARRRRRWLAAAYSAAALAGAALLISWGGSFAFNRAALASAEDTLVAYRERAANIPVREVRDADFLRVLGPLDAVADVPAAFGADAAGPAPFWRVGFGLGQEERVAARHREVYADALGAYLLPRYAVLLQERLRDELPPAEAFETLKHYLALSGLGPVDVDALTTQAEALFDELYPGPGRAETRARLMEHLNAMLALEALPPIGVDETLVAATREEIAERDPARRVLDLLETRRGARALSDWTPRAALGPAAVRAFEGEDGDAPDMALPGLYTRQGYREVVLPQVAVLAELAAGEGWVRGAPDAGSDVSEIARGAVDLYWAEFDDRWRGAVGRLRVRETVGIADAADLLQALTTQARPLTALATSIAQQTDLAGPGPLGEALDTAPGLPFDPTAAPDPYAALRRALGQGTVEAPALADLDTALEELAAQMGRAAAGGPLPDAGAPLADAAQDLAGIARNQPAPLDALVLGLAADVSNTVSARARDALSDLWTAGSAAECRRAVEGRYPFDPDAGPEVAIADFSRLFGPGGVFDAFFETHLDPLVDRSGATWTWTGGLGTPGETSDALRQFQRAAAIRTAFFPAGAAAPQVDVGFELLALSGGESVVIDFGSDRAFLNERGIGNARLTWPHEEDRARFFVLPGTAGAREERGDWAAFRLLGGRPTQTVNANTFDMDLRQRGREARVRVTAGSVNNPFDLPAIAEFDCPGTLLE